MKECRFQSHERELVETGKIREDVKLGLIRLDLGGSGRIGWIMVIN